MQSVVVQALPSSLAEAARLAAKLGTEAHELAVHRFPDGELRLTVGPVAPVTIVYGSLDRPNEKLIILLLASEALRRNGASRVVLVSPYMCYMRQDTAFHPHEAISQKVIGQLLAGAFDRIVTVHAHLHRIHDIREMFPGVESSNLTVTKAIAGYLRGERFDNRTMLVGPDEESQDAICELALSLGLPWQVAQKVRHDDRHVEIMLTDAAAISGRPVLLLDDIISSGGTIAACARTLLAACATAVDVIVTHALFPVDTELKLRSAGIRHVLSTSSVSHRTNVIPLDEILADALRGEGQLQATKPQ